MAIHHPIAIRFNEEDHAVIRALMKRTGQPIAGVLRYAIRALLQQLGGDAQVSKTKKPAATGKKGAKRTGAKKGAARGKKS